MLLICHELQLRLKIGEEELRKAKAGDNKEEKKKEQKETWNRKREKERQRMERGKEGRDPVLRRRTEWR